MANDFNIVIEDIYEANGFKVKTANLRVGSSITIPTLPSVDIKKIKSKTIDAIGNKVLIENNATLTLKNLRKMDSDQNEQNKFIKEKLRNYGNNPAFLIIRLLIDKGEVINEQDIDYLLALLNSPYNSLIVPPLVYYYKTVSFPKEINGRTIKIERDQLTLPMGMAHYISFLNKFIQKATTQYDIKKMVMTIPTNISHIDVNNLLHEYRDLETPIGLLDLHGRTPKSLGPQINELTKKSSTANQNTLRDKHDENFVLYAFDAITYTSHQPLAPSQAVMYSLLNINLFGPRHTVRVHDQPKDYKKRIFASNEYSYANEKCAEYQKLTTECGAWSQKIFANATPQIDDYTIYKLINTIKDVHELAKNNEIETAIKKKPEFYRDIDFLRKRFKI